MKDITLKSFDRKIANDSFDANLARGTCFAVALFVLGLSFWKLTQLELSEAQLFFGVLLSLSVPLLFIIAGLLLPLGKGGQMRVKD